MIREAAQKIRIPFFVIGGIDLSTLNEVLDNGAERAAVVRAAFGNPNIRESVRRLKKELTRRAAV